MTEQPDTVSKDPYASFLGISVDIAEPGFASCSVTIKEHMFNFLGVVHGGLVFSLADVAFSLAANNDHHPSFALDVSGSFLKSAGLGDTIHAEAEKIHSTGRTGVYRIQVFHNNDLIATFNGTVYKKHKH